MCGIAGIINFTSQETNSLLRLKKMTDSIRHRGPDGEGYLLASPEKFVCAFSDDTPLSSRQNNFRYSPTADVQSVNEIFPVQLGHRRLSIIDLSPAGHQPMCSEDTRYWITYNGEKIGRAHV